MKNNSFKESDNLSIAEQIIKEINFSKIYKTAIDDRKITEEEKQIILDKLNGVDCKNIYDSFINAGINQSDISGYIINLLIDNGFKGYTLEELSKLKNLNEIIEKNIKNFKSRILAVKLDSLFGIKDDLYQVDGTYIKLRDYQYNALQNIDKIFETKRFAGMILPTGAGKSFVTMSEMMNFRNSNIVFIAPQNAILLQFQKHIVKNILKRDNVPTKDLSKCVEEVFPHLKMFCYDTIAVRDEEWLKSLDADLIILDEIHRSGAETYEPQIKKLIKLNSNSKVLGMTATPIRDIDHKDMMREVAEMTEEWSIKELNEKSYLATEMYLLDAIRDEIVVSPKIVTFDYTLEDSREYKEIKRMVETEKNASKKAELKIIYNKMTAIIEKSKKDGMKKIIKDNIIKENGRYIIFLPTNQDTSINTEIYIKNKIEEVKEYFEEIDSNPEISYLLSDRTNKKENLKALSDFESSDAEHLKLIFAINMLNEGIHVDKIDGAMMLRPISDNSKILYLQQIGRCIFAIDPENPIRDEDRPIIFDVYNNYLAQDIDREINRTNTTSDLIRLESVIKWIDKHKGYFPDINSEIISEAKKAIILKTIQRKYKKYNLGIDNSNLNESEKYEIQKIIELGNTINLWNIIIPERVVEEEKSIIRNNTFVATGSQKEFIDLFKQAKSMGRNQKLTSTLRTKNIVYILDILAEYGIEINNNNIKHKSKLRDVIKKLPEDIKEEILGEVGVELNFNLGEEYNYAKQEFFNRNKIFTQYDIKDLRKFGIFEPFVQEESKDIINITEREFIKYGPMLFRGINIRTGTIYDEEGYDKDGYDYEGYNRLGYNKLGYDRDNFKQGSLYNEYGFNKEGIHKQTDTIYDEYGFKIDKTFKETGKLYNDSGFDINRKHIVTGTIYDEQGYDIDGIDKEGFPKETIGKIKINKYGFDKNGYYYEKQEDGTYESTGLKYNKFGFMANKKHVITQTRIDLRRFDIEGKCKQNGDRPYDANGFRQDGTYRDTGERYHNGYNAFGVDKEGKNKNGWIHPDIAFCREYILGIFHGKRNVILNKYKDRNNTPLSNNEINIKIYRACEMFPDIKELICKAILRLQVEIQKREQKIEELKLSKTDRELEIEKLEKENEVLQTRINHINENVFNVEK